MLSRPVPTQFHTTAFAGCIEELQGGVNSVLREGILNAGVNDFELENGGRMVEDYHLVGDGQRPFGTCADHPKLASS